jgi:hypothetical protein
VACADQDGAEVAVLVMVPGGGSEVGCAWADQFAAGLRLCRGRPKSLDAKLATIPEHDQQRTSIC